MTALVATRGNAGAHLQRCETAKGKARVARFRRTRIEKKEGRETPQFYLIHRKKTAVSDLILRFKWFSWTCFSTFRGGLMAHNMNGNSRGHLHGAAGTSEQDRQYFPMEVSRLDSIVYRVDILGADPGPKFPLTTPLLFNHPITSYL